MPWHGLRGHAPQPEEMSETEAEFLRIAELSSIAPPESGAKMQKFLAAREVLWGYALRVIRLAENQSGNSPPGLGPAAKVCPLRSDEPRDGLAEGEAFDLAPEEGNRFIRVPRVL